MARARNIKPSFFTNEQLSDNCPLGRLLFIGLWTLADYKGDLEWKEKTLKIQLLPWDDCSIKELAINLDKSGLVRFYSDGFKIYLNIPNFQKHQNPHKNEKEKGSDIPLYTESMRQLIDLKGLTINRDKSGLIQERSHSDPADSLLLNPESLLPITDTRQVAKTTEKKQKACTIPNDWVVTQEHYDEAIRINPSLENRVIQIGEEFYDYWKSTGKTKADWMATWRNWIRKVDQYGPKQQSAGKSKIDLNETGWLNGTTDQQSVFGIGGNISGVAQCLPEPARVSGGQASVAGSFGGEQNNNLGAIEPWDQEGESS